MIEAVILAGGLGTRLKSISGDIPKPMVKVGSQPFLYHLMQKLESDGIEKIVLSLSYMASYIIEKVKLDKPVDIPCEFVIEEQRLGTGGAIKFASLKINSSKFIVLNGDTFLDINFKEFIEKSNDSDLFISAVHVDDVSRYGTLDIDQNENVIAMIEKGRKGAGYINSGAYIVSKEDISSFSEEVFSFEEAFIPVFDKKFKAYKSEAYFIDIGIPEDYKKACEKFS